AKGIGNLVMKNGRVHVWFILITLAIVVGVFSFGARGSRTEPAATSQREQPVKPTALKTPTKPANANAAAENAVLKNELSWTFGGKQQRGWYVYDLLISKTLDSTHDSDTSDFAAALARWQKRSGLGANGVLDENSLMRLISQWQSTRLKTRGVADASQLLIAPPADFYDPSRAPELRQLERNTYAAYKEMLAAAIADPQLKLAHTSRDELAPKEQYFKIV